MFDERKKTLREVLDAKQSARLAAFAWLVSSAVCLAESARATKESAATDVLLECLRLLGVVQLGVNPHPKT